MAIITHSEALLDLVKKSEGCKLTAYQDTGGIWTIGWGATTYENGLSVKQGDSISQIAADNLLDFHLHTFDLKVSQYAPPTINQNMHDALTDFAYNVGAQALLTSTLLKKVHLNINDATIAAEFAKWMHDSKGSVLEGLKKRRAAEAALYFTPVI